MILRSLKQYYHESQNVSKEKVVPKFHAHTNREGPWAAQVEADIANQTVFGGIVEMQVER